LLHAGVLGPPNGPVRPEPEAMEALFGLTARLVDLGAVPESGLALQWSFADAPPWRLELTPAGARALPGETQSPDLRLRAKFGDWCDLLAGRANALRLGLSGRVRTSGRPAALLRLPRIFGRERLL
jgi:hypothetical protein